MATTGLILEAAAKRIRFPAATAVAVAILTLAAGVGASRAQGGETVFAIDVDTASSGVQDTRATVAVGESVHVRVVLQSSSTDLWGAYQVSIEFASTLLEPVGLPENWGDEPTEEVGGNLAEFTSGPLCDPSPPTLSVTQGALALTCAERNFDQLTSQASGDLVDIVFRCIAPGEGALSLSEADNTFLLDTRTTTDADGQVVLEQYSDAREGAAITCAGDALTATPAPATTGAPDAATTPPGTPGGPDTGPGGTTTTPLGTPDGTPDGGGEDGDDDTSSLPILIGIIVAVVVVGAGGAALLLRRRT